MRLNFMRFYKFNSQWYLSKHCLIKNEWSVDVLNFIYDCGLLFKVYCEFLLYTKIREIVGINGRRGLTWIYI